MDWALQAFLVFLFIFIVVIVILIICMPSSKCGKSGKKKNHPCPPPSDCAIFAIRSGCGLPAVDVPSSCPLAIVFTRPDDTTCITIKESANYTISYTVQLAWSQEATVELALRVKCDSTEELVMGSQEQAHNSVPCTEPVSHTFRAHLKKGSVVQLLVQASEDGAISIPAADAATLLLPTTLASLVIEP